MTHQTDGGKTHLDPVEKKKKKLNGPYKRINLKIPLVLSRGPLTCSSEYPSTSYRKNMLTFPPSLGRDSKCPLLRHRVLPFPCTSQTTPLVSGSGHVYPVTLVFPADPGVNCPDQLGRHPVVGLKGNLRNQG